LAISISLADKKNGGGESGIPGKITNPISATGIVKIPSMMNSHRHPGIPATPERFVYAAAWRYPLTIVPSGLQMNQVPARLKSSGPEYQEPLSISWA
jgi:hypothetical protein